MNTFSVRRTRILLSLFIPILLIAGMGQSCAVRTPPPPPAGTPPVTTLPQTALQWTIIYNGALAKTNSAVEQSVESVHRSGAITTAQARPIIIGCGRIAQTSEAIRAITSSSTEATWAVDGPKIRALLASAALTLPPSQNATVDLAVAAANAAITLLTQGVR